MRITTYLPEPLLPRLYAFTFYNERTDFVCVCVCVLMRSINGRNIQLKGSEAKSSEG